MKKTCAAMIPPARGLRRVLIVNTGDDDRLGWFHRWAETLTDEEKTPKGGRIYFTEVVGLIEWDDGHVTLVDPRQVQFVRELED